MGEVESQKKVVFQGEQVPLPSAQHAKIDELKRRHDALEAEAEKLQEELQVYKIDEKVFDGKNVPREVRRAINDSGEVWVSEADSNYRYAWIFRDPFNKWGNKWVSAMKVIGWEVVSGDMKEAKEHAHGASRERIVSDCILMRTRLDNYLKLQMKDRARRRARQEGITAQLDDLGSRHGVTVRHEVPESVEKEVRSQLAQQRRGRFSRQ